MVMSFLFPLVYSLLAGTVWSLMFHKKFLRSLAPAYMFHVLLVLISGLVFQRLSVGIYGGIILFTICFIILVVRKKTTITGNEVKRIIINLRDGGLAVFIILYLVIYFLNIGKRFLDWDEFSHWGMYIKENLRLDNLFCASDLSFAHKDYVPALPLFETIWCKIAGGGFSEETAYRSIQMFMISLLLPMFEQISDVAADKYNKNGIVSQIKKMLFVLSAVFLVMFIPLVFRTNDGFKFYHSVYADLPVGIVLYWCTFEIYNEKTDNPYQIFVLTLGMSFLVLTKMTSMALVPFLLLFLLIKNIYTKKRKIKEQFFSLLPVVLVPVLLWAWYNRFVDAYIENTGSIQSYDGMKLSSLADVIFNHTDKIPYLDTVRNSFFTALVQRSIVLPCFSYVIVLLGVVFLFLILGKWVKKEDRKDNEKIKLYFSGIWVLCFGVFYALLMFFLYATTFSEFEALALVSYERYMNSFAIAIVIFFMAVFFRSDKWKYTIKYHFFALMILTIGIYFISPYTFNQILPGSMTKDNDLIQGYTSHTSVIEENTSENSSVYIITRGDNGDFLAHQRFYCAPRKIGGGSIGPALYEGDIWSTDLSKKEFVKTLNQYDYVYFCKLDEAFTSKYSDAFMNSITIYNGKICKISDVLNRALLKE